MKGTHSSVARQEKEVFFMSDCVFCKIVSGEIPSPRVYEDDEVIAINDLSPIAPIHVLIIPKKHTENIVTAPVELVAHVKKILPEVHEGGRHCAQVVEHRQQRRADGQWGDEHRRFRV